MAKKSKKIRKIVIEIADSGFVMEVCHADYTRTKHAYRKGLEMLVDLEIDWIRPLLNEDY